MLRIVTDSTCDLPREAIQALAITVVPLSIFFGDEELLDGVDIQADQFFRRLERDPHLPRTSQPTPALFTRAYQRLVDEGATEILSIHISSKLSGTLESARLGAQALREMPGLDHVRVEHIDSATVSLGLGIGVLEAGRRARAGAAIDEALAATADVFRRTQLFFTLDTLEYLRRGGRMSRGQEFLGTLLRVKPIISVQGGELVPVSRVRTRQRAVEDLIGRCADLRPVEHLFVAHSTTPDEAGFVRDRLAALDANAAVTVGRITPVVGVHTGPGTLGVGVVTAPDDQTRALAAK